jgi:hypothetical protein
MKVIEGVNFGVDRLINSMLVVLRMKVIEGLILVLIDCSILGWLC